MTTLLTVYRGKSLTIGFVFPVSYDLARIEASEVYLDNKLYESTLVSNVLRCEISSNETAVLLGNRKLSLLLDDSILGMYPIVAGIIKFDLAGSSNPNESVNTGFDLLFPLIITETAISVDTPLYNYFVATLPINTLPELTPVVGTENIITEDVDNVKKRLSLTGLKTWFTTAFDLVYLKLTAKITTASVESAVDLKHSIGSDIQDLSGLVVKNTAIVGATKTKVTYDSKGLVTSGVDATTADIADSTNKRYQTDNQQSFNDATSSIQTQLNAKQASLGFTPENAANKNANNGYAPLDSGGKVPLANLPSTLLKYIGQWNAFTNIPTLINSDVDKKGYVYDVSVAGTQFGIVFDAGDWLIYNDSGVPEISLNSDNIISVNGQTGTVTITLGDLGGVSTSQSTSQTIGDTTHRATKLWATDIESTNMPTVNGTSIATTFQSALGYTPLNINQTTPQTIGATGTRLAKLWAVDGEFTNMPTVGGVGILSSLTDPSFSSVEVGTFGSPSDYGAGGTAKVLIADNYNAPSGMQMYNSSAGTSADFRFTVFNTAKNQYVSISTPGDGNTLTLFGSIRSTSNYIFNNTATGGTARDLTIGTVGGTALIFGTYNIVRMRILPGGNIGFGLISPTAVTHFKAGSATAGTAPAKYNSGTLMTTPEVGAFEFNTDAFYGTITTGAVRRMFVMSQIGRATAQTAANASIHTFTLPATDGSYQICANVLVTTSSAENFTVRVAYTDEGNTARTATMTFQLVNGTIGTNIAFANGAVPYMGHPLNIRCKASTAITVATTGTFTGCTYNVETIFKKVA